jgi:hypothetical protein
VRSLTLRSMKAISRWTDVIEPIPFYDTRLEIRALAWAPWETKL